MAIRSKIKSVTVHYPTEKNKEEFERRYARAVATILFNKYSLTTIDKIIAKLKNTK